VQKTSPHQYLHEAELLYSQEEVEDAVFSIAKQLNEDYIDEPPIILCVMSGAAIFTGMLLPKLTFPLEFDYVQATRYRSGIAGSTLHWIVKPKASIENRNILILDDILDEGVTLKAIAEECQLLGANVVKIAVLVNKELNVSKPISADYIGITVSDRYVFGCGMDVYGWWRNLPSIYALKNT
jgi:hypoxanthine phosphoribosyltransferase